MFAGAVRKIRPGFAPRPEVSHVVFDFDGTLSWLRHGWPAIMCRLFREVVPLRPGESDSELDDQLLNDILALNGKPSIHQMRRCAELVAERGGARPEPEKLLLEYSRRLDAALAERTKALVAGESAPDDFVVHGARPFLERLQGRGLGLVILSGTVEHRVKEEAELLGLTRFFGRHIYGGTADAAQSDKRAVVARLLREEAIPGGQLLAVGDGPVELRIAKDVGGVALGVASDEDRNGSGRFDRHKVAQLREAGADVLIADYREPDALLEILTGR